MPEAPPTTPAPQQVLVVQQEEKPKLVAVQNMAKGPTVFTDPVSGHYIEWEGAGHESGTDVQYVNRAVLDNPNFVRNVNRGIFRLLDDDPETRAMLARQTEFLNRVQSQREEAATANLSEEEGEDLIVTECLISRKSVVISKSEQGTKPPLAPEHEHLAHEFVLHHDTDDLDEDGRPKPRWIRASMGDALDSQVEVPVETTPSI